LALQRFELALRHRERVVAELDLPGLLVPFVHREIDDPAEAEGALLIEPELLADAVARLAGERAELGRQPGDEEHGVAVLQLQFLAQACGALRPETAGDRPRPLAVAEEDVAEP